MVFLCCVRTACCGCVGKVLPKKRQDLDRDIWQSAWDYKSTNIGLVLGVVILVLTCVVMIHSFYIVALDPIFIRLIHFLTGPSNIATHHGIIGDGFLSIVNVIFLLIIIVTLAIYKCFGLFLSFIVIPALSVFSIFNCFQVGRKTILDIVIPQFVQFMDQLKADEDLQKSINIKLGIEKADPVVGDENGDQGGDGVDDIEAQLENKNK